MKKASVAILLLVINGSLVAQTRIGLLTGVNISSFSEPDNLAPGTTWSSRLGVTCGIELEKRIWHNVALAGGINYIPKGIVAKVPLVSPIQTSTMNHYLELPLMIRYSFAMNPKIFIELGPRVAYLVSSKSEVQSSLGNTKINTRDDYKNYDLSVSIGLGLEFVLTNVLNLNVAVDYGLGLHSILVDSPGVRTKDAIFVIGVSYAMDDL